MRSDNWDELAMVIRWAREHEQVLVDSHWVGGNPMHGEIYGWAAWKEKEASAGLADAVITLRNPSSKAKVGRV